MSLRTPLIALLTLAGAAPLAAARPSPSYFNDFEGESAHPEWSITREAYTPGLTSFLGNFSNELTELTVALTQGAQYRLTFDFYAIDTWDGNSTSWGPDRLRVYHNTAQIFSETFSNITTNSQSYTGPALFYLVDRGFGFQGDSGYRINLTFTAGATNKFGFLGTGLQPITDESWGLDNVTLTRIPAPGAGAGLLLAAGLAGSRRRRGAR